MVTSTPDAGLFSRLVRRLSLWLQPRAPRRYSHFSRFRQCSAWFRRRREVSAQALEKRAKRQDLVRRREFEHLRSLRASAVWPPPGLDKVPAAVAQPLPTPTPAPAPELSAIERAQTLQKIDAIEALMSPQKADGGVIWPAGSGWALGNPRAESLGEGEGEGADADAGPDPDPDDGATRLGSASDPYPAKPPKSGST